MCADLVELKWRDRSGKSRRAVANLEDISASGACVQIDVTIAAGTHVTLYYPEGELTGTVRYCHFREIGYFVGVQFEPGRKWSRSRFRPMHMLDPRSLMPKEESSPGLPVV